MTYIAPVANAMGWSLEQTAAGIMAVSDAGVKGSMAGQAFATSMARLAKPTRAMFSTMTELNLELFDAQGNLKSLPDLVGELEVATKGMTREQKSNVLSTMFGAQAYKHWAIMLERGSGELDRMTGELENADGAAAQMADTMMDNLGGQWELFKSGMAEAAYSIYQYFEPALRDAVKLGIKFAAMIPPAAKAIAKFAKPFKPLGKAVLIAVGAVGAFLGMIVGIKLIAIAFGLLASPIGLAILAITGIVLAFQFAYKYIEPFRELIDGVGRGLEGFWALLQGNEGKGASLLMSTGMTKETYFKIKEFADGIIEAGKKLEQAKGAITGFFDAITNGGGTADGFREMLESGMGMDQIKKVYEFANQIRPAFDAVKQAFTTFKEGLTSGSVGGFMEALGFSPEAITSVEGTISSLLGVFESVKSAVTGFIESVTPSVSSLMENLRSFGTTLTEVFSAAWSLLAPVFDGIGVAIGIIGEVATMVFNNIIVPSVNYAIQMFQLLWKIVGPILELLGAAIKVAFTVLKTVWDNILSPFIGFMTGAFKTGLEKATPIIDKVGTAFDKVGGFVSGLAEMVRNFADALKNVTIPEWVSNIGGKIAGAAKSVGSFLSGGNVAVPGNYHGLERVPYDNYMTRLHRGERVLTRQEADAYDGMDYATASAGVGTTYNNTYNNVSTSNSTVPDGKGGKPVRLTVNYQGGSKLDEAEMHRFAGFLADNLIIAGEGGAL